MDPGHEYKRKNSLTMAEAPRGARAGARRLIFWAIVGALLVSGASYWLTRTPESRQELRSQAAASINSALDGTPLAGLGRLVDNSPPPPPPEVTNPPTEAGTLAGRTVVGTIAAPLDFGASPPHSSSPYTADENDGSNAWSSPPGPQSPASLLEPRANEPEPVAEKSLTGQIADATRQLAGALRGEKPAEQVVFSQEFVPKATEDTRLKPSYVSSLAQWLARNYKPGTNGGSLTASIQALNQECGVRLAANAQGGRSGLLRYAFHPAMIDGLYRLYIDRFMADLQAAANERGFDAAQARDFHLALAGRAAVIASAISGVLQIPDLRSQLNHVDSLGQKVVDANTELTTAVFELDQQRENKAARQVLQAAQLRVTGATARYRRASADHEKAQNELAAAIRRQAGPGLDAETLLFIAAWAARREGDGGDASAALQACVQTLHNFSARCRAASTE